MPAMQSISRTRIIGNHANLARSAAVAAIVASAQRASTQILTTARARRGNGGMVLAGPYTGAADSVVDVEVLGGPDGEVRATAPVVAGVGNGTLEVQSLEVGAVPQTLRFTLLSAGTQPVPAMLDFFGVQLAARAVGAAGNALELSVTRSLTYTDLPYATLQALPVGAASFDGPEFDWGQPAATAADIPAAALRIAFAGLPTVHRAWKSWDKGKFAYKIDPPLVYQVPENTRVRAVAGDYTISVTDGVDTETYTAVTMYEFLAQVQARSALLQVLGVVAEDRTPGGQAVTDIPLRTDAHALPVIASTTRRATMQVGAVASGAATENITVTCMGRADGGEQMWSVSGGVSGQLPAAYTGRPYTLGPVDFTIPTITVPVALGAAITGRFTPTSRATGEGLPAICFKPLLLGVAATDKEVTYVYRKRPPADCSCSSARPLPVSLECLGLLPEDGGGAMDTLIQTRLVDLMEWRATFLGSNIDLAATTNPEEYAVVRGDLGDVALADTCIQLLVEALQEVYDTSEALAAWEAAVVLFKAELAAYSTLIREAGSAPVNRDVPLTVDEFARKYAAKMDVCRAKAGIFPKSDAGSVQGSPCWRDYGDEFWWEDSAGNYLPIFTNRPYVSVKRDATGAVVSTQEFGLGLVTECEVRLKEGDQITIRISGTHNAGNWAEGDRFVIPVISASSAPLTGGADGNPTQTWTARSSVLGALPDWAYNPTAPAAWADGPATVALLPGGIPFEVGDSISFDIEGGRMRWRRDGGAWTEADVYGTPLVLGDGLTLQAQPGAAPSFLAGDTWQFRAVATYGIERMRQPRDGQAFAWDGDAVTIDIDLGVPQPLELVMLAMHTIAPGATVSISGGLVDATEWTVPAVEHARVLLALAGAGTAQHLQVVITGAGAGGSIGWLFVGKGWQPTVTPSRIGRARTYGLARGRGLNPAAIYRGAGVGGEWGWDVGADTVLLGTCADDLLELIDHAAGQGMEPVALVPDLLAPRDASVAIVDADEISMEEFHSWQSTGDRAVSLTLPLRAVLS